MMSSPNVVLNIARQFSKTPLGRYPTDGPNNGEKFRETLLAPSLRESPGATVVVELDGTEGYGSSFLEEAFGGLVRHHGFRRRDLSRLSFVSNEDESLTAEIQGYLEEELQEVEKSN